MSDREIFEKYKAGRAIIAAGIKSVEEFNAERTGPLVSAEIIDCEPSGIAKLSVREIFEKYKAGRAIIAAGIKSVEEFNAERTGPLVFAEFIDCEPTRPTLGIVRTVTQPHRTSLKQKETDPVDGKSIPSPTE